MEEEVDDLQPKGATVGRNIGVKTCRKKHTLPSQLKGSVSTATPWGGQNKGVLLTFLENLLAPGFSEHGSLSSSNCDPAERPKEEDPSDRSHINSKWVVNNK